MLSATDERKIKAAQFNTAVAMIDRRLDKASKLLGDLRLDLDTALEACITAGFGPEQQAGIQAAIDAAQRLSDLIGKA